MTGRLSLRETRSGKELCRLSEQDVLAWSPDGNHYANSEWKGWKEDDPKYLLLQDTKTGKQLWKIPAWPYEAWFSRDGKILTYWDLNDRTIHQVDAGTGKKRHVFRLPADIGKDAEAKAISPNWKLVAVKAKRTPPGSGINGWKELQVWDIDGKKLWTWPVPEEWQGEWEVRFLPGDKVLLDAYARSRSAGAVCIFDAITGKKLRELPTGSTNSFLGSSPDGSRLVVAGKEASEVHDVATGRLLFQFKREGIRTYHHNLAFSPNSQFLAFSPDDFTIEVRELATGKMVSKFHRPTYFVTNIAFAPDGRTIALAFNDCTIWMWDALAGQAKREAR